MYPDINIFGTTLDTYNLCFFLSLVAVLIGAVSLLPKDFPLKKIQVFWATVLIFITGFLGTVFLNIIMHASEYRGRTIEEIINEAGVAYLGGPFLAILAMWIYCKKLHLLFLQGADYAAPFFMLERIFARLGCLGYGCCYGISSDLPWAHRFCIPPLYDLAPRHPTQAYAIICALAILASSRYLYRRTRAFHGITFFYVILSYSTLRFFNEFLRAEGPFVFGPVKLSHIALFIFVVITVIGLFNLIRKSTAKEEILKALKGTVARLVIWLLAAGAVILFILSHV